MSSRIPSGLAALLLMLFLLPWPAAGAVVLGDADSLRSLNAQSDWLVDEQGELSAADLCRAEVARRFQPAPGPSAAGLTPAAYWLRLDIQRPPAEQGRSWWLVAEPLNLFDLRLYLPDGRGCLQERLSGERVAFAEGRDQDWRQYAFRLPDSGTQPLTLYVRSQDPGGLSFPLRLWREEALAQHMRQGELLLGLVYGLLLGLSAYNFFLALTLRDSAYLMYVAATLSLTLFLAHLYGHTAQYLWPHWPSLVAAGRVLIPSLWGFCIGLFVISFFQTRRFLPRLHRVMLLVLASYAVIVLLRLAGAHGLSASILSLHPFFTMPLVLLIAMLRWRQGFAPARYFLLGYGGLLSCTLVFMLRINGVLAPSGWTDFSLPLGAAFETLVFSLALADRIRALRREGQAAYRDELTGLGNRRELERRFDLCRNEAEQQDSGFALLALDLDQFKPINDRYGHAVGDRVLQILAQRLQGCVREQDLVARIGGDEFLVLLAPPLDVRAQQATAKRVREAVLQPLHLDDLQLRVGTSIGQAAYPADGRSLAELGRCADIALYAAKREAQAQRQAHYAADQQAD